MTGSRLNGEYIAPKRESTEGANVMQKISMVFAGLVAVVVLALRYPMQWITGMRNQLHGLWKVLEAGGGRNDRTLLMLAALGFAFVMSTSSALAGAGDLDPGFGVDGKVTTDFSGPDGEDEATEILKVRNDKFIAVGTVFNPANGTFDFALARYHEDGKLDRRFGKGGKVLTDFGGTHDRANGAVIDDDGGIIVVGSSESPPSEFVFALARYHRNGRLDTRFGRRGLVTTAFPTGTFAEAEAVAVNDDDKIFVVGAAGEEFDPEEGIIIQPDFAIACYDDEGRLCHRFGDGGLVVTDFSGADESFDEASDVVLKNRKIIVAGFSQADEDASEDFALARYNHDGSLDRSFGDDGLVTTDFDGDFDVIEGIALQDGGYRSRRDQYKIVAAGITVVNVDPEEEEAPTEEDFALVRYNADGSIDTTFNTGGEFGDGKVVTDFREGFDLGTDVAVAGGKIIVVGVSADPESENEEEDMAVARYNFDGSLDTGFGDEGKVLTDFAGSDEQAASVIVVGDRIIAAGSTSGAETGEDFAIAAYETRTKRTKRWRRPDDADHREHRGSRGDREDSHSPRYERR